VPVGILSNRHDKPGATGEDACTRDDGSGGPSSARSGGTTDHAGTEAYTASRDSGERRTDHDRADNTRPGIRQRAATCRGVVRPPPDEGG